MLELPLVFTEHYGCPVSRSCSVRAGLPQVCAVGSKRDGGEGDQISGFQLLGEKIRPELGTGKRLDLRQWEDDFGRTLSTSGLGHQ